MEQAFNILVIMLSTLLAIFLIISIITAVIIYRLVKSVKQIVDKGEHLVSSAEEISEVFRRNATAAGLIQLLVRQVAKAANKSKRK